MDFLLGQKKRASTLEEERFHCQAEEIEVYESSSHEKKVCSRHRKGRTFSLHSTATKLPMMRQKKKKSISNLFSPAK
jgi:hypothetical protein